MKRSATLLCAACLCVKAWTPDAHATEVGDVPAASAAAASAPNSPQPSEPFRYSGMLSLMEEAPVTSSQKLQDSVLRIVTPAERKKDVALMVVGALLGGFRTAIPKEDYKGEKLDAMPHPAGAELIKRLEAEVDGWAQRQAPRQPFKNPLWIRKDRFQLVYGEGSNENLGYDLKIEATLSRKPDGAGFFTPPRMVTCSHHEVGTQTTLAQWQADDYAKVKAASAAFVEACAKSFQDNLSALLSQ